MDTGKLRVLVATIEAKLTTMASVPFGAISPTQVVELQASWAELVRLLALGPEPKIRACPACHRIGMLAATRCGYCWTRLRPPE